MTRWATSVNPENALPEYPRPQMVRADWTNLNGLWSFAITSNTATKPMKFDGTILVPYPLESALSGVQKALQADETLWYRRTYIYSPDRKQSHTILNFGAVDWFATVYVNDTLVGTHAGGYESFSFDITNALKPGPNDLTIQVYDPTTKGPNPHGKQTLNPSGISYTSTSGIWQTVWLEKVPETHINGLVMSPNSDKGMLNLQVRLSGPHNDIAIHATVLSSGKVIANSNSAGNAALAIPHARLWSPDDPYLYDLTVQLIKHGKIVDSVTSYFGMRKIEIKKDEAGRDRIFLNDHPFYNLGILDQGFWPEGLYTAPTDEALKFDISAVKAMGFNTIRKHIKVEPDRWYYYCDKVGVLVWQDMVNPGQDTAEGHDEFEKEAAATVSQLWNHPSIVSWVLFNEGWGLYDQKRLTHWIKTLDGSRIVDGHSGANYFQPGASTAATEKWQLSDLVDTHDYRVTMEMPAHVNEKASVIGEFGGSQVRIDQHIWDDLTPGYGYNDTAPEQFSKAYEESERQLEVLKATGLSGSIYTQLVDVENEQNGLITYDREIAKIPLEAMQRINAALMPARIGSPAAAVGNTLRNADLKPQAIRYDEMLDQYASGKTDLSLLRRLTLMAVGQKDHKRATLFGNEYISRVPQPYGLDTWRFISFVTRTSKDLGFELLRSDPAKVDDLLGEDTAENKIMEIIAREDINPLVATADGKVKQTNWAPIEKDVIAKYGPLGAETIYGLEMNYYGGVYNPSFADFGRFGKYFLLYFQTSPSRHRSEINNSAFIVFEHVSDPAVLHAAIELQKCDVNTVEPNDADAADTYASLLYKDNRTAEAISWERKAIMLWRTFAKHEGIDLDGSDNSNVSTNQVRDDLHRFEQRLDGITNGTLKWQN